MKHVIIHGLRRSGTTILWETLRTCGQYRCYDEPLHPRLAEGHRSNHKGTWTEFADLLEDGVLVPQCIAPLEELDRESRPAQIAWLGALCRSSEQVVMDIVRGWNRIPELHAECGDVLNVHLVRDPFSWAAAHLLPSGHPTARHRIANIYRRVSFFSRRGFFDNYQYQTIIHAALEQDHPVVSHVALTNDDLRQQPAHVKLLAFWWGANCTISRRMQAAGSARVTVTLDEFSRNPQIEMARILRAADSPNLEVSTACVRVGRPAYGQTSAHWRRAVRTLGLPASILEPGGLTAAALEQAFLTGAQA